METEFSINGIYQYRSASEKKLFMSACNHSLHLPCADLQHIEQDERVSMGLNGDLYFSHALEKDSRRDYCCFAAFPTIRTIVQKNAMSVIVKPSMCAVNLLVFNTTGLSNLHDANLGFRVLNPACSLICTFTATLQKSSLCHVVVYLCISLVVCRDFCLS